MMDIPGTWAFLSLSEIGEWRGGGTPSKANSAYWNGDIPWVSPKDMKVPRIRDTADHVTKAALKNSAAKLIPAKSVLIVTRSGILAHSFPVAVTDVDVTLNQDLKALIPAAGIDPDYVSWALNAFHRQILDQCAKYGTTVHSIEFPRLMNFKIPLAPTNEQLRIVGKIEELFSKIDEGERCLTTVSAIAERALGLATTLRHSILKKAFAGQLVCQDPNDEPASELIDRIKAKKAKNHKHKRASGKDAA